MTDVRVGIIGAGRIGGGLADQACRAAHDVLVSFSRDPAALRERAAALEARPARRPKPWPFGDLVVLSVPWVAIDEALSQAGTLRGRVVVDTTNQFGPGPKPARGQTAAAFNASRMPGARYVKCFNTLTSAFQAEASSADRRRPRGPVAVRR